jgi:hypothetical protein
MTARARWSAVALGAAAQSSTQDCEAVVWLDSDQVWTRRVQRGSDLRVTCLGGLVWMTREGDSRDHFLRVEDTFTSREPGMVYVQAIVPSQLHVAWKGSSRPVGVS